MQKKREVNLWDKLQTKCEIKLWNKLIAKQNIPTQLTKIKQGGTSKETRGGKVYNGNIIDCIIWL